MTKTAKISVPKIMVVGSINYDVTTYVARFPRPGETVSARSYLAVCGGKGLNQAVAASRIGADVSMVGCVGADDFGGKALAHLAQNGVNTDGVTTCDTATGFASIMVEDGGENVIAVAGGANKVLAPTHVTAVRGAIEAADILIAQCEPGVAAIKTALEIAAKAGVPSVLNPAPAKDGIAPLLALASYITPNQSETKTLTGIYPQDKETRAQAFAAFKTLGVKTAIITCGAQGSFVSDENGITHIPAFPARAIDTTGAGDVFNGVFAAGLARGQCAQDAAFTASAASALSVTKDTADSAPSAQDVAKILQENR